MLDLIRKYIYEEPLREVPAEVSAFLYEQFSDETSAISSLDRWTQRRISDDSLAKVSLVLAADDPVEHCYQNLIREIDAEAEVGIFLARPGAKTSALRALENESGISGSLYQRMKDIAPLVFPDEFAHTGLNLDMVWVTVEARYDRAYLDAEVSRRLIARLLADEDSANDMTDALRALLYAFHEDIVRRQCGLPTLLDQQATTDLATMIAELDERSGDYDERLRAIGESAAMK